MKSELKLALIIFAVICAGVGAYYWHNQENKAEAIPATNTPAEAQAKANESANGQVQFPVPTSESSSAKEASVAGSPVPKLAESDAPFATALAEVFGDSTLAPIFISQDLIRSIVVTVDNLGHARAPSQFWPVKAPEGEFVALHENAISPNNYDRYEPYVSLAEKVDQKKFVKAYVHFYPLFQQVYGEDNGDKYFNDRLVEIIDSLIKTPEPTEPPQIQKGIVSYKYSDPNLEKLNAGQKILLRMGPKNSSRLKTVLKQLRAKLVHLDKEL